MALLFVSEVPPTSRDCPILGGVRLTDMPGVCCTQLRWFLASHTTSRRSDRVVFAVLTIALQGDSGRQYGNGVRSPFQRDTLAYTMQGEPAHVAAWH